MKSVINIITFDTVRTIPLFMGRITHLRSLICFLIVASESSILNFKANRLKHILENYCYFVMFFSCGVIVLVKRVVEPTLSNFCVIWDGRSCAVFNLLKADQETKKRRTFRKYFYRGVDLDQLLDMT